MNKTLITLLVLFGYAQLGLSQLSNYLDNSAVWNEEGGYFDGVAETHALYYSYSVTGDTTINSLTYLNIHKNGIDSASGNTFYGIPPSVTVINESRGALRQDSGKFYFMNTGSNIEYLLYDFNMSVGDTIPQTSGASGCGWDIVVSTIDTVYLGIQPRRRYTLSTGFSLIEGVGAESGLFGHLCQFIESGYKLKCFSQNGALLVIDTASNCELTAGLYDKRKGSVPIGKLNIHPNPMNQFAYINLSAEGQGNYELQVYNSLGQLVRVERNIGATEFVLKKNNLFSGLYTVQLYDSSGLISSGKIVVR